MKKILIMNKNIDEITTLKNSLEEAFEVHSIMTPHPDVQSFGTFDTILIDHVFTDNGGCDYIDVILKTVHIPILMLAPPDDPKCAIEAVRAGAFNYVIKSGHYETVLPIAINDAISRFTEQEGMRMTIVALKKRIAELEALLGSIPHAKTQNPSRVSSGNGGGKNEDIVREIINRFKQGEINLPSVPQITLKFQELVDGGADYRQISELLRQDVAIASKLIMVSNSVVYRGVDINGTLEQAISRLGISVTKQYVNVISNRALYTTSQKKHAPLIDGLWRHSLSCAYVCQAVAKILGKKIQFDDDPFMLGLLHDIGKLILLQVMGELEMRGQYGVEGIPIEEMLKIVEAHHGLFGSALLKRWKFPNGYINVSSFHDNLQDADLISKGLLIVHFSNLLVKGLGFTFTNGNILDLGAAESTQLLGIDEETIGALKKDVLVYMENVGKMLI